MIIIVWCYLAASELLLAVFLCERLGMDCLNVVQALVLNGWLFCAAYTDWKCNRIANRWIVVGLCAGIVVVTAGVMVWEYGWPEVTDRILGACLGSGILFGGSLIRRGGIGMGDVKLFFVLGLFGGTERVFFLLLLTLVCALAVGAGRMLFGRMDRKDRLPLGPFAYVAMILMILGENLA